MQDSTPLYLAVTCSMLVLPEECLCRFFLRDCFQIFLYAACLLRQYQHVHASLQRRLWTFTHFCVKVDSAPEVTEAFG